MKQNLMKSIFLLALVLVACTSGTGTVKQPEHLLEGMRENQKGITWYHRGCYHRAMEHFLRSHELFSASDQVDHVAMSLNNMANVYRDIGDRDSAFLMYRKASDIYTRLEDTTGLAQTLSNLAALMIDAGRLDEAEHVLDQVQKTTDHMGRSFPPVLKNRGILMMRQKKFAEAEDLLKTGLKAVDASNLPEFSAINAALGRLMLETKQFERAAGYLETALKTDRFLGYYAEIAQDLSDIGIAYENMQQYERAVDAWERSLKIFALLDNDKEVEALLGRIQILSGKAHVDLKVTEHFIRIWREGQVYGRPCQ